MREKPDHRRPLPAVQTLRLEVAAPQSEEQAGAVSGLQNASLGHRSNSPNRTAIPRDQAQAQGLTLTEAERIINICKRNNERWLQLVLRLKEAILDGDARLEHALACELCNLPVPEEAEPE